MSVKKTQYTLLLLIAITLPFYDITDIVVILFALSWLWEGNFRDKFSRLMGNKQLLVYLSFFLLYGVSLIYTEDLRRGVHELNTKIFLLVFPLLIGTMGNIKQGWQNRIIIYFLVGCTLASVYLVLMATINYYNENYQSNPFFYQEFTAPLKMHAIYFAMYVLFALIIVIDLGSKKWSSIKPLTKLGLITIVILLSITLLLCSSKTMILIPFVLLLLKQWKLRKNKLKQQYAIFGIICFALMIIVSVQEVEIVKERLEKGVLNTDFSVLKKERLTYEEKMALNGINVRMLFWKIGVSQTVKENKFLIGNSPGDTQKAINREYVKYNLSPNWFTNHNMHNQYVEEFVQLGLVGFVLFLILLFISYKKSVEEKNLIYFWFLLIFSIASLSESMLERNKGLLFFCFFNSIFLFQNFKLKFYKPNTFKE